MPELPEVETIKRGLCEKIVGKKIISITSDNMKSFQGDKSLVINKEIENIERRAKIIRIKFNNGYNLLFHLKMTGQLIYVNNNERFAGGHPSHDWHLSLPNKHTRIIFKFNDNSNLFFNDLRKFGWCKVLDDKEIETIFQKYGPEPLSSSFSLSYLMKQAQRFQNKTIKQFIMDQEIIAGVGNIYADESLFLAKIMPKTKVKNLNQSDWEKLIAAIIDVLTLGIKFGGTTDSDYVNIEGKKGGMQDHLNVYHKTGEKCSCGGTIERTVVGGRGTNYCPNCQKEKV